MACKGYFLREKIKSLLFFEYKIAIILMIWMEEVMISKSELESLAKKLMFEMNDDEYETLEK